MTSAFRAIALLVLSTCATSLRAATTSPASAPAPAPNHAAAIANARRIWNNDSRELADLLRRLAAASDKAGKADRDLTKERRALADLDREERDTMDELRRGAFCTGCGKTRSEIERNGDSFPHPGQQSRPATPEELDAAKRGFDGRRTVLRRRIDSLDAELKSARSELEAAHHRYLALLPAFHTHIADEQQLRLGKWLDEKTAAETELKALRTALAAPPTGSDPDQARKARTQLEERLLQRENSARLAEERARQEERQFRKDALASLDYLAGIAKPIPDRFGVSGPFIATSIRNSPKPIGYTVPGVFVSEPPAGNTRQGPSSELQNLLEGKSPPKSTPSKPSAEKSVQDLLNGK
jgi:hypothetical protein